MELQFFEIMEGDNAFYYFGGKLTMPIQVENYIAVRDLPGVVEQTISNKAAVLRNVPDDTIRNYAVFLIKYLKLQDVHLGSVEQTLKAAERAYRDALFTKEAYNTVYDIAYPNNNQF